MGRRGDDFDCFSKSEVDLSSIGDRYVLKRRIPGSFQYTEKKTDLRNGEPYELEIYHKMISYL